MDSAAIERAREVFARYPCAKLAYLFGSRATGNAGPLSDYDFAVYIDGLTEREMFDCQLDILSDLNKTLGTDAVDLVNLTTSEMPELKYDIVKDGLRIYTVEPYHVLVEPRIWNEYFDFHESLVRNGLTRSTP
jgi:hypothetical protein